MEMNAPALNATTARVLLASNSPRRRELLRYIVPDYGIAKMHDIDERYPADLPVEEVAPFLSRLKAEAYSKELEDNEIIITADTVVINDGKILGKPTDAQNAVDMLKSLVGHSHHVITGVTLSSKKAMVTFAETTKVIFDNVTDEEIEQYVAKFKPMDKAGAYGIQEWIGAVGIKGVEGDFYNVMGLPLHTLYQYLRKHPV